MSDSAPLYTSIGGQAVIEGVMMRSPRFITVAVRRPDHKIVIQHEPYIGIAQRVKWLRKPILRGVVMLIESMVQGMNALTYSANIAAVDEKEKANGKSEALSSGAIALSIGTAMLFGMGLFVALPHALAALLFSADSPWFHAVDGLIKMTILLSYVYAIAWMKDIHRVFQYHGAEHKSISAFEHGLELTVENARPFTTRHPRCGTSFLLFLVLISIAVFSIVFPLFGLTHFSQVAWQNHVLMVFVKIGLMFPVAGLSYEFIKACACRMDRWYFRALIWPGMLLQEFTTREPTDDQLEVALASLKLVLKLEKESQGSEAAGATPRAASRASKDELEIATLSELGRVQANVAEFPEAR